MKKYIGIKINAKLLDLYVKYNNHLKVKSNKKNMEYLIDKYTIDDNTISHYIIPNINGIIKDKGIRFSIDLNIYQALQNYSSLYRTNPSDILNGLVFYTITQNYKNDLNLNDISKNNSSINYPKEIINYKLNDTLKQQIITKCKSKEIIKPRFIKSIDEKIKMYLNIYKMRYIFKYSPNEIYTCFKNVVDKRALQSWLLSVEWNFDIYEAQQLASSKERNYVSIKNKGKNTLMENYYTDDKHGSEGNIRVRTNLYLQQLFYDKSYEIIVGLNTYLINENGKEIDVPIIIIYNDNIYKFGIEVNGDVWHKDKNIDDNKYIKAKKQGYKIYYIDIGENTRKQRKYGDISKQISNICHNIYNEVINN